MASAALKSPFAVRASTSMLRVAARRFLSVSHLLTSGPLQHNGVCAYGVMLTLLCMLHPHAQTGEK